MQTRPGFYKIVFIVVISFASVSVYAQDNKRMGQWTMFFGQMKFAEKWSLHAEAQFRDHGIYDEAEQILMRGGLNYHITPAAMFTAGYGRITNYADDGKFIGDPVVTEHRIWQQFQVKNSVGRIGFDHRYRLEQRFIESNTSSTYQDRVRYFLRATVPLNKEKIENKTVYLTAYDEIFIRFTRMPFDRNRLYAAIGYRFNEQVNVQGGGLAQTVNDDTKYYLQAALFYNLDVTK